MRALVLSVGGSRGAFQVGVIRALAEKGREYELVTGASIGAVNGAYVAQFPVGDLPRAAVSLEALWLGLRGDCDVYKKWPLGALQAALPEGWFGRPSLYNDRRGKALLRSKLDAERISASGRALRVLAVNGDTGELRSWSESDAGVVDGVLASAAFTGMFLPVVIDGAPYTDGGLREIIPIRAAVEAGATEMDIVTTFPRVHYAPRPKRKSALDWAQIGIDVLSDEVTLGDRESVPVPARWYEPEVLQPDNSLSFDPGIIRANIDAGYEIGKKD